MGYFSSACRGLYHFRAPFLTSVPTTILWEGKAFDSQSLTSDEIEQLWILWKSTNQNADTDITVHILIYIHMIYIWYILYKSITINNPIFLDEVDHRISWKSYVWRHGGGKNKNLPKQGVKLENVMRSGEMSEKLCNWLVSGLPSLELA